MASGRFWPFLPDHGCAVLLGHHPGRMLSDPFEQGSVCRVNNSKNHVTARGRCCVPALGSVYRRGELGQAGWAAGLCQSVLLSSVGVSLCPLGLAGVSQPSPVPLCRMLFLPHSQMELLQREKQFPQEPTFHVGDRCWDLVRSWACDTMLQAFCLDSAL